MSQQTGARVLIVDDEPLNLEMLSQRLLRRGYRTDTALSATEAFAKINESIPDIILLDVFMPGVSGYEILTQLRADPRTESIPVILVSAHADSDNVVEGLKKGANDYVTKPVNLQVLLARLETQLRMSSLVRQLEEKSTLLARLAEVDELTGVYNRRVMTENLDLEIVRTRRYKSPLSLMMLDLDHFKSVNDTYGHSAGDAVLKQFAQMLLDCTRKTDLVCRYGGEEFCVICPETSLQDAVRAAEHIRLSVEALLFRFGDVTIPLTVSIGISCYDASHAKTSEELISRADKALYEAKNRGRNRVCVAENCQASRETSAA